MLYFFVACCLGSKLCFLSCFCFAGLAYFLIVFIRLGNPVLFNMVRISVFENLAEGSRFKLFMSMWASLWDIRGISSWSSIPLRDLLKLSEISFFYPLCVIGLVLDEH